MSEYAIQVTRGGLRSVARVSNAESTAPPGGGGGDAPIPNIDPVLYTAPLPFVITARLRESLGVIQEGSSIELQVVLSRPAPLTATIPIVIDTVNTTADPANYTITAAQGGSTEVTEFIVPAGQDKASVWINTTSNFAEGTSRQVWLSIDDDPAEYTEPVTGSGYRVKVPNTPFANYILQGNNGVSGSSVFQWGAATLTIPEDVQPQAVQIPVFLDPPLPAGSSPVVLDVAVNQLQLGPQYEVLTQQVTFQPGVASQPVVFRVENDAVNSPLDTIVQLTLSLVSGSASAGAITTLTVTVEDDEPNGSSDRFIQWQTGTQFTLEEGSTTPQIDARIVDANGDIATAPVLIDVPVVVTGTATGVDGGDEARDYRINWPIGSPEGYLRFEAGQSEVSLTVEAVDDGVGEQDETVILTINDDTSGNGAWQAQTANGLDTLTITITDEITSAPTELLLPSATAAQPRMIQGLIAVNPPSATLPTYQLSTGETVQAVGMRRNGDDEWTAAYFYGLGDQNGSKPAQSGSLSIDYQTDGTAPASAGSFIDSPALTFSLDLAGVGSPMTTTTATAVDTQWLAGVNEECDWAQSGPDLVRQRLTRHQFHVSAPTSSIVASGSSAGQGAGLLELCETRIAGNDDVILYEGRFGPCGWLGQAGGLNVDGFSENPFCDGEMYVDALQVEVPAGFQVEFGDAHPNQAGNATTTGDLLTARTDGNGNDQPYWFGAGDSTTFWFAVVRTSAAGSAIPQARDYIRKRNIAWTVGPLGVTENPIYGDAGECAPDWRRAGLSVGQTTGWDAIEALGDTRQTNAIASWTSGDPLVGWSSSGGGSRAGRTYEDWVPAYGSSGGTGISGVFGWIPWGGYWYERMMLNHRIAGRIAHYVDMGGALNTFPHSGPVWAWRNTQTVSGETKAKQTANPNEIQFGIRLFHFNDHRARQQSRNSSSGSLMLDSANGYATAPTSRPWNYPVEIASSLTVSELRVNGNVVPESVDVHEVVVSGTIPATTPAKGIITVERSDGYLHKAAYVSWSGATFTLDPDQYLAPYTDFRAQASWTGATVRVYEGDPDEHRLADRTQHDWAHASRFRDGFGDWWGMRSWLSLSVWADLASRATQAYNPWLPVDDYSEFNVQVSNLANKIRTREENPAAANWDNTGVHLSSYNKNGNLSSGGVRVIRDFGQQVRGLGWATAAAAGYFQAAGDTERAEFRGEGGVLRLATPRSWVDDQAFFLDMVMTEYGVVGRKPDGAPNAYGNNPNAYGQTEWQTRTGLVPNPTNPNLPTPPPGEYPYLTGTYSFHTLYAANGVNALRQCLPSSSQMRDALGRMTRYGRHLLASQMNWLTPAGSSDPVYPTEDQFCTYVALSGYGSTQDPAGELEWKDGEWPNSPPSRVTLEEFTETAGQTTPAMCWFVSPGTTRWKWAWLLSQYAWLESEDQADLCARLAFGRPPEEPARDFARFLMEGARINESMSDTGSIGDSQQQQFALPLLGYLLNQF